MAAAGTFTLAGAGAVTTAGAAASTVTACSTDEGSNCEQFAKCNVRDPLWRVRERILTALGECTIAELAADTPAEPIEHAMVLHTHI